MTTTQRPRPQRPAPPAPNPASRGVILVAVAVVLGAILLIKGGGIGFDQTDQELTIDAGGDTPAAESTTTTTAPAPSTSVAPASLKVVALNGAGINGYAGSAQQFLSVAGYTSTTAATAATQTTSTIVYYAPGYEADALAVAELFGLDATSVQPIPDGTQLARDAADLPTDTNVVVLLGPDVQNRLESSGASSSTTTTVAGATSSGSGSSGSSTTTTTTG
jgi:hypothetical protein